jgi:hypothetical protein
VRQIGGLSNSVAVTESQERVWNWSEKWGQKNKTGVYILRKSSDCFIGTRESFCHCERPGAGRIAKSHFPADVRLTKCRLCKYDPNRPYLGPRLTVDSAARNRIDHKEKQLGRPAHLVLQQEQVAPDGALTALRPVFYKQAAPHGACLKKSCILGYYRLLSVTEKIYSFHS